MVHSFITILFYVYCLCYIDLCIQLVYYYSVSTHLFISLKDHCVSVFSYTLCKFSFADLSRFDIIRDLFCIYLYAITERGRMFIANPRMTLIAET